MVKTDNNSNVYDSEFITHFPSNHSASQETIVSPSMYSPTISYSVEEENWINRQLQKFDTAWQKIHLGEDHIKEFIMYSFDVPLSKGFMANAFGIFIERFRMVLKIHPEFNSLNQCQQHKLWKANSLMAIGVIVAKLEACKTGNEQFAFAKGNEMNSWIFQMAYKNKMKKLTMDMANISTGVLSATELESFGRLVTSVGDLIQDQTNFKLFTLVLLFSDDEACSPEMKVLRNTYLNVIRRCNSYLFTGDDSLDELDNLTFGHLVYSKFSSCISSIKELALYCVKVMGRG